MSRVKAILDQRKQEVEVEVEGEVERMDFRPDHIDADTWEMIQDNGRLATERLNEILLSPKFHRLRAGDQAKLIALAQNRAYGMPVTHKTDAGRKAGSFKDVTASALRSLVDRSNLPEYQASPLSVELNDEEEL